MVGNPEFGLTPAAEGSSNLVDDATYEICPPVPVTDRSSALASGSLLALAPFPLEETFFLHSLASATYTIYLDFDGFITRETPWNEPQGPFPANIVTPPWDIDLDPTTFSDDELGIIQQVWERVAEDFRPFNINVTTQDPGVDALIKSFSGDETYGQRVAIGGTNNDWFKPIDGFNAGGVAHRSFGSSVDDPCFVFYGGSNAVEAMADTVSHEVGHTLGLGHDGQTRFYEDISQDPPEPKSENFDYYGGHPDTPTPDTRLGGNHGRWFWQGFFSME